MHRVTLLAVACSLAASAQTSSPVGNPARTPAEIVVTVGHYFGPQIGIAKTAFFPTVTLSASAGFESLAFTKWLAWPSRVWSVGPSLAQTIFDAGLRKATVQQFQASYDQAVATYRETVLTAFQHVEDNLASLRILS